MNIYDFDNTIYNGDTNPDIIRYSLVRHPFLVISSLLRAKKLNRKYKKGEIEFERVKETMLSFLFKIKNRDEYINNFVNSHMKNIKKFYYKQQKDNDILISASYELWIGVFAKKLGIKYVIATKTDKDGFIIGKNCKREEKLRRLASAIPNAYILSSYSDSESDIPMLEVAKTPYVVEGENLIPYKKGYNFKIKN